MCSPLTPVLPCSRYRCESNRYSNAESLAVWTSFRPPTNCDEQAIVRAREFLYHRREMLYGGSSARGQGGERGRGGQQWEAMDEHHVPLRDIYFDPLSRSVIDDASVVLHHAYLEYWRDCAHSHDGKGVGRTRRQALGQGQGASRSMRVPCAYYSIDTSAYIPSSERLDRGSSRQPEPQFEEMGTVVARVHPGDLLCVMDNSYQYPHSKGLDTSAGQQWYLTLRIDLLFARVLVQKCRPPPHQWLDPAAENVKDDNSSNWIAISKLWKVVVCSRTPSPDGFIAMTSTIIR